MSLAERPIWEELWKGYLDFYNTKISQETKSVRGDDPNEPMYLLAASLTGTIVGMCITSTSFVLDHWRLLLSPGSVRGDRRARQRRWGRLIKHVEKIALTAGASRIY